MNENAIIGQNPRDAPSTSPPPTWLGKPSHSAIGVGLGRGSSTLFGGFCLFGGPARLGLLGRLARAPRRRARTASGAPAACSPWRAVACR